MKKIALLMLVLAAGVVFADVLPPMKPVVSIALFKNGVAYTEPINITYWCKSHYDDGGSKNVSCSNGYCNDNGAYQENWGGCITPAEITFDYVFEGKPMETDSSEVYAVSNYSLELTNGKVNLTSYDTLYHWPGNPNAPTPEPIKPPFCGVGLAFIGAAALMAALKNE